MSGPEKKIEPISIGLTLALGVGLFVFLGNWLGRKIGHEQFGMITGGICGLMYGAYEIWKLIKRIND